MRRVAVFGAFVVVFLLHTGWSLYSQTAKPPGTLKIDKVVSNLHVISGEGGNVAVYVTDEGVVLVDDMTWERMGTMPPETGPAP